MIQPTPLAKPATSSLVAHPADSQVRLTGLSTALPPGQLSQEHTAEHARDRCCAETKHQRLLDRLYARSGVKNRHSILRHTQLGDDVYDTFYAEPNAQQPMGPTTGQRMTHYAREAGHLAHRACSQSLGSAGIDTDRVTHLVTVSCTGFQSPGFDIQLIQSMGLKPTVQRTHVGFMGCHGAMNGLRAACALARSQPNAVVLLCCLELCSVHLGYGWRPQQVVANSLFGDGVAAMLVLGQQVTVSEPPHPMRKCVDHASYLIPDSLDAMTWVIGDHGFEMTLSPSVPQLIDSHVRGFLTDWLSQHDLGISDIRHWVIHPGGPRVVDQVVETLGIDPCYGELSKHILARYGNMSSPTVLFILDALQRELDAASPATTGHEPTIVIAFGPGLTAEAALLH